ncbi:MAG: hypothetical protein IJR14_04435 [Synergistaceae bacterium]|nr:hypothetical protein [Synergistaceae bacterium]
MMREEFARLTGQYPTASFYKAIEEAYYAFDGDKAAFCEAWREDDKGIATGTRKRYDIEESARREAAIKAAVETTKARLLGTIQEAIALTA